MAPPSPETPGSLTDVFGIRVGHYRRVGPGWQTGTTAIIVPGGAIAACDIRGGGPGTRETDALNPGNLVDTIHGICLTGGSAFGLAAADGVMSFLESKGLGVRVGPEPNEVVPVVPAAVIFDLGRGGQFANRPTPFFGVRAASSARTGSDRRGSVGAGTGAIAGGLQGGVGMASTRINLGDMVVTVAALAVVNAAGSLIDPSSGLPWYATQLIGRISLADRLELMKLEARRNQNRLNTTIGVVATDAWLSRPETGRMAQSAHDGLARAVRPCHLLVDGDTIFGLSVPSVAIPVPTEFEFGESVTEAMRRRLRMPRPSLGDRPPTRAQIWGDATSRTAMLDRIFAASADVFALACVDAIASATTIGAAPALRDVAPSAFK